VDVSHESAAQITADLEALKHALIEVTPEDMNQVDAEGMAREISAIRLQLKRLEADRYALH
jgi:hypothetical protein